MVGMLVYLARKSLNKEPTNVQGSNVPMSNKKH